MALAACTPFNINPNGSVIVIAISQWSTEELGCTSSTFSSTPMLDRFCSESVRFTHAYTPSPLEAPALSSLLTGVVPQVHGVHNNGASRYNHPVVGLPQMLWSKGYETGFFSSGLPFVKKTAISDGFETFDDYVRGEHPVYRPADAVTKSFFKWLESRPSRKKIFAVLYWGDLQFPGAPATAASGEARESSRAGQIQNLDEVFGQLSAKLREKKIWDGLTVVVTGLEGSAVETVDESNRSLQLVDDILHIPLLVKPSHRQRDLEPGWKTDIQIDLADLGQTLWELAGFKNPNQSPLPSMSFAGVLRGQKTDFQDRPLLAENDLPFWRDWGPRLYAVRIGEIVYQANPAPLLFNTYTDRYQLHNLMGKEKAQYHLASVQWESVKSQLALSDDRRTVPLSLSEKLRVAKLLFKENADLQVAEQELLDLTVRRPGDWQVVQWLVDLYLRSGKFQEMYNFVKNLTANGDAQAQELEFWREGVNIGFRGTDVTATAGCLQLHRLLRAENWPLIAATAAKGTTCMDSEANAWLAGFAHQKMGHRKEAGAFLYTARALYDKRQSLRAFSQLNWYNNARWDFSATEPGGPAVMDWFLALNSNPELGEFLLRQKQAP